MIEILIAKVILVAIGTSSLIALIYLLYIWEKIHRDRVTRFEASEYDGNESVTMSLDKL